MSITDKNEVVRVFVENHQKFMGLLRDLAAALRARDVGSARAMAKELNNTAGAHVAFEEEVLFPMLDDKTHDRSFVSSLYEEHKVIEKAIERLLVDRPIEDGNLDGLLESVMLGLERAEHCGTLISRLSELDEVDQQEALDELNQLRAANIQWTQVYEE